MIRLLLPELELIEGRENLVEISIKASFVGRSEGYGVAATEALVEVGTNIAKGNSTINGSW